MLSHSSYHILESLMPPSIDEDVSNKESALRLENLSACAVVRNIRSYKTLSELPTLLHKIMWKAYLSDEYYMYKDRFEKHYDDGGYIGDGPKLLLDELQELLLHWPHEKFILKELMPILPPKLYQHNHIYSFGRPRANESCSYYYENKNYLLSFYEKVAKVIVNMFKKTDNHTHLEYTQRGKLRQINLSGFFVFNWYKFKTDFIHMHCPFTKQDADKIELVVDMDIYDIADALDLKDVHIEYDLQKLTPTGPDSHNSSKSVSLKFGHVRLCAPFPEEVDGWENYFNFFVWLLRTGPTSLTLGGNEVIEKINAVINMIRTEDENENLLNIVALTLSTDYEEIVPPVTPPLNCLQHFQNLIDLDLSGSNLHGRLNCLNHMQKGLVSLDLRYCDLTNEDLTELTGSCHQPTLKVLNLASNNFKYGSNLIKLCKNFTNLIKLDLCSCDLDLWKNNDIKLLLDAFRNMPNIITLDLNSNNFSKDIIRLHIKALSECLSLKYLKFAYPQSDDTNAFSNEIKSCMNRRMSRKTSRNIIDIMNN